MRAICVVAEKDPERLPEVLKAVYSAFWVERKQIWNKEGFQPILEEVLGFETSQEIIETVSFESWTSISGIDE